MSYKCEFCEKVFKQKYNLLKHQKTAKYCIEIQKVTKCLTCNKIFSSKYSLSRHLLTCQKVEHNEKCSDEYYFDIIQEKDRQLKRQRDEYEKRISELNQQVQNLQDKIENIAIQATKRPTTINNQQKINLVQNLKPITEQHLREQVENFGMEHFKNGIQGLAKYAIDYPLKDRVICTDDSRYQFKWRDGDNDDSVVCDRKMITLVKKLFMALRDKNSQLADVAVKEMRERYFQLTRQVEDNEEDIDLQHAKLIEIAEQITKYNSFRENVNRLAEGEEIDIYKKFIDIVCSHVSSNSKILVNE